MQQKRKPVLVLVLALICLGAAAYVANHDNHRDDLPPGNRTALAMTFTADSGRYLTSDSVIFYKCALDNSLFMQGTAGTGYLYFEAKATDVIPQNTERTPLNLSLVIDRSGSMQGEKLEYAKKAALFLVDQLKQEDYLSLVIYDDTVDLLVEQTSAGAKEKFKSLIREITSRGSTNLCGGMQMGLEQLDKHYRQGYVNRVLLMSDGLANQGIVEPNRIAGIASSYAKEKGITVSTFGVGLDFNEDLMTSISESGSGNYYFIGKPEEISSIFEKELNGLMNTVAQNAKLSITLPNGVELDKVFGYNYEQHGQQLDIIFREIFANEVKSVLIRFRYKTDIAGEQQFLATLQYNDAIHNDEFRSVTWKDSSTATADTKAYDSSFRKEVREQAILFEANERMDMAMRAADEGDYDRARSLISANGSELKSAMASGYTTYYITVQDSINSVYFDQLQFAEKMEESELNEMQKSNKSGNYEVKKKKR